MTVPEEGKTPWLDDDAAPAELRALVATGRADGPSAEQLERLAGRIAPLVGVTAATLVPAPAPALAVAPASPASLAAGGTDGKVVAAKLAWPGALKLMATACVVGAGYLVLAPAPRQAAPSQSVATAPVVTKPVEVAAPARAAPVAAPATARGAHQTPAPKRPLPRPSELELIHRAESAEPARALVALRTHERLYPDGMLAQEREVLAIRTLLALDRRADAEARAARMAELFPGSAHLRRVRVLLGERAGK